jgi:molybdenum cofactor cytidylyltransferase
MGTPKALLPWRGTTLLGHALDQAREAGVDVPVVVLGPATPDLAATLDARVAFNPDPQTGRSASIRIGSALLPDDVDTVLIQSVDQPCQAAVLTSLFAALEAGTGEIAVPTYAGRRGHPICVSGHLVAELRAVSEEEAGLRSVVRRHAERVAEIPVSSAWVVWNLNDPDAYTAALEAVDSVP